MLWELMYTSNRVIFFHLTNLTHGATLRSELDKFLKEIRFQSRSTKLSDIDNDNDIIFIYI